MGKMTHKMLIASRVGGDPERRRYDEPERYREPERDMRGQGWITWDRMEQPIYPERGNITDMREYGSRSHDDAGWKRDTGEPEQGKIGFARDKEQTWHDDDSECMDKETAERWVRSMVSADGTRGGKWRNMQDVRALAQQHGMGSEEELPEFWAALNATYSDIAKVAKKYNVDRPDFYADIASALYFDDVDAVDGKLEKYYRYLVKKE